MRDGVKQSRQADGSVRSCVIPVSMALLRSHFQVPPEAELVAVYVDKDADQIDFRFVGIGPWVKEGAKVPFGQVLCSIDPEGGIRQAVKFEWPKGGDQ